MPPFADSAKMSPFRRLVRRCLAATLPRRWFLVSGPVTDHAVCLTFDDGPHPEHTPRLLDVLRAHQVRATFFVIGERAERYQQLVRRIEAEGHVVGHHTYSHSDPRLTSAAKVLAEVRQTRAALAGWLSRPADLFRPPHGKLTAAKLWLLWRERLSVVLWNSDPRDYAARSPEEILDWFHDHPPEPGDVILMHDDRPHASLVVPGLVALCRERGLQFATPFRWIGRPPGSDR